MTSVYPGRSDPLADAETIADAWVQLEACARVVGDVLSRFLAPLRSGEVVAFGSVGGVCRPISPAWWDRAGSRIDPDNGDLCRVVETGFSVDDAYEPRGARERESIAVEWLAIEFGAADTAPREFTRSQNDKPAPDGSEISRLRNEIDRLRKELSYFKHPERDRDKTKINWDFALDQVFMMVYMQGYRYEQRKEFVSMVLDQVAITDGEKNPEQLFRLMRDYYPQFWAALKG